jgi:hypothetical protein
MAVDGLLRALAVNLAHELQTSLHRTIDPKDRRPNGGATGPTGPVDPEDLIIGTGNGTNGFAAGILEVIDFFWQAAQASFN